MTYDIKISNGVVILENEALVTEVGIKDGIVVAIGQDIGDATRTIDASGLIVSRGTLQNMQQNITC